MLGLNVNQLEFLSSEEQQRAIRILAILGLLEAYPVEDASDTLIDVTLARIDQYESSTCRKSYAHLNCRD